MSTALLVFSKAPVAGAVKTRLIPALGAQGAARLQQRMTRWMVKEAVASGGGEVTLCCAPDCTHPDFQQLQQMGVRLQQQHVGDIGQRMSLAIDQALQQYSSVILMGCDCPQLDRERLQQVDQALQQVEVVLLPAEDGGYVLIAMRGSLPQLFEGIDWSSERVMTQTEAVLNQHGVSWKALPTVTDIDRPEDLINVPKAWLDE